MLHRRHMPLYLIIAWALLDLLLFGSEWVLFDWRFELRFVLSLLLFGQFAAISGWITIGKDWIQASLGCIAVVVCLLTFARLFAGEPVVALRVTALSLGVLFIYGGMLNLPLLIARSRGWGVHFDPRPERDAVPFYQFSLREVMLYTLLVAVVAGLWTATRPAPSANGPRPEDVAGAAFLVTFFFALPIPWSIWLAFAWARPIHGALVALLVMSFWSVVCVRLFGVASPAMLFAMIPPGVLIVHLLALQLAGFRLQQDGPIAPPLVDHGPEWENDELWKKLGAPGAGDRGP